MTTTTPNESRATAAWAAEQGITYLDGAIMAVPEMIGRPLARLLYSGDENAYAIAGPALETLGTAEFGGTDAGVASLKDMALLTSMYLMFSGLCPGRRHDAHRRRPRRPDRHRTSIAWLSNVLPHARGLRRRRRRPRRQPAPARASTSPAPPWPRSSPPAANKASRRLPRTASRSTSTSSPPPAAARRLDQRRRTAHHQ